MKSTFAAELEPGEEYRASALGRAHRLLDEERRRSKRLADAVRGFLCEDDGTVRMMDVGELRAALAAWERDWE